MDPVPCGEVGEALNPLKLFIFANLHFLGGEPLHLIRYSKGVGPKKKIAHLVVELKDQLVKLPASRPTCLKLGHFQIFHKWSDILETLHPSGPKLQVEQSAEAFGSHLPVLAPTLQVLELGKKFLYL